MPKNIIECLDDPHLLGGMLNRPSWKPWRVMLKAVFALPMAEDELATYRHHTGRQTAPRKAFRYVQKVVGRRGGKSLVLGVMAVYIACVPDHSAYLSPGETPVIAIIAQDRRQAQIILGYIVGALRASDLFSEMIVDVLAESVLLSNGVLIEVHTASIGAPRGRTFLAVLADECAFWPVGDSANPDVEVINAVRPGLATIPYSLLLIASSPYAKRGLLYQNFARYFGRDDAPVLVWQGSTEEMNSTLIGDPLIAEMYSEDPERASAEFGAQFRSDIVAFITREAVEDCLARDVRELPPSGAISYVGHVDPSGGSADSMTLAVAHLDADGVAILDAIREVKPPFSPDAVVEEFAALLKSYGISRVTGDAYAGEWPRERFAVHGIAYDVSKKNTSTIYGEFLPALNARRVQLLDLPRLVGQLVGLERRTARAGRDSIAHAPGSHDDVANAACGALVQVISDRRPALVRASSLTIEGSGVTLPTHCDYLMSMTAIAPDGMVATVFAARCPTDPSAKLYLADFLVEPLSAGLCQRIVDNFGELARRCRPVHGIIAQGPVALTSQGERLSQYTLPGTPWILWNETPPELELLDSVAVCAAALIAEGHVKTTVEVMDKASASPWGGALDFRAGDAVDSPLRTAVLQTVYAGLWGSFDAQAA
jgi:hypothetical protein